MNAVQDFNNRQYGYASDYTYDFALRRLCVAKEDSWRGISPSNYSSDYNPEPPIFAAKFANCKGYRHMLAIANEDGKIALQDTTQRNYEPEERALDAPQCHFNAVFDLEWAPDRMRFVSASGDHSAHLWEVDGSDIRSVRTFTGHTRSVKTAAFRRNDSSVFATGGRDGAIVIWDTRAKLNMDLTPRADNCIYSGHVGGPGTPVSQRRRTRTPKMASNTSSSITGLVFQDANTLISCGAGDGVIKVWDLRRNYTTFKKEPHPKQSLPYAGSSTFKGFTNLLIDEAGAHLYANCMDNTIYCYNLYSYAPKPLAKYRGFLNSTFYIKSCLSPDGKYLLSGSSDEKAYIWNLGHPDEPLVALSGHAVEVTCVAWGSAHDCPIVTCSDDARHKIWRIGPEDVCDTLRNQLYRGHADYVRRFGESKKQTGHPYNLRDLESTPRSMKRFIEQSERTPSSIEKVSMKRSFLEMLGVEASEENTDERERKRAKPLESRGRRLFSPSTTAFGASTSGSPQQRVRCLNLQLSSIHEASASNTSPPSRTEESRTLATPPNKPALISNKTTSLPSFNDRTTAPSASQVYASPPSNDATTAQRADHNGNSSSVIYSPTSNLPNYVLNGDAPHLGIMSPKRKLKDKVDWLTKIRKQKLMSCRGPIFTDKINDELAMERATSPARIVSSPRVQSLRNGDHKSPSSPRRRVSHTGHAHDNLSPTPSIATAATSQPRTPTSSRRNSETTLLRFFSVQQQSQLSSGDCPPMPSTGSRDGAGDLNINPPPATAACSE